nr:integrase, catalytic region, zinc finger, CCHC-type, peptidase aspartic, catalytic [Tanacetum cinerariifolium]
MSIEIRIKEKLLQQEQWAYLSTHPSKRLTFFCYDDDDDNDEDYTFAITPDEPVLSTEEPDNSLSMGDEHLDTIPATKLDEFIKSGVENLIPIPSESEGIPEHMCVVPSHDNSPPLDVSTDQIKDFSESKEELSSIDDDSFSIDDIDYVEASPPDSELVSSELMEIIIPEVGWIDNDILLMIKDDILREKLLNVNLLIAKIEALNANPTPSSDCKTKSSSTSLNSLLEETNTFDNSLPEFKTFCFDVEEISSGSTTTHPDISLPKYEVFYVNHVKEISSGSPTTYSDSPLYASFIFDLSINPLPPADRSDIYEFTDELIPFISPPEYDCFLFKVEPNLMDFTKDKVGCRAGSLPICQTASFKTRLHFVSRRYCVLPKKTSCVLLQEDIQCTGSDTRPPMLDRTDFASWQQRIRLYCRGKDNGVNILKSIDEGPYKLGTFRETLAESTEGTPQFGPKRPRVYSDLKSKEKDRVGNVNQGQARLGQARTVKCYNCNGGPDNAFHDDVDEQLVQDLALSVDNMFQAKDCDAFDSDVDEAPTTQTMFIANLSSADPITDEARPSYDSDILSEVQDHDQCLDDTCAYQEEHVMHNSVQLDHVVNLHTDYTSVCNMISYDQYVKDNDMPVVHSNASSVQNDTFMIIYNDMCEPSTPSVSNSSRNAVVKNSLTVELATYREQVELYE